MIITSYVDDLICGRILRQSISGRLARVGELLISFLLGFETSFSCSCHIILFVLPPERTLRWKHVRRNCKSNHAPTSGVGVVGRGRQGIFRSGLEGGGFG